MKIDLDRGISCMKSKEGDFHIYMYLDEPGLYYNANEVRVPDKLAKAAGFDVETHKLQRLKREKLAKANAQIDEEIAAMAGDTTKKTLASDEKTGFRVVDIGLGRANVLDHDGGKINNRAMTHTEAMLLYKEFTSMDEDENDLEDVAAPKSSAPVATKK